MRACRFLLSLNMTQNAASQHKNIFLIRKATFWDEMFFSLHTMTFNPQNYKANVNLNSRTKTSFPWQKPHSYFTFSLNQKWSQKWNSFIQHVRRENLLTHIPFLNSLFLQRNYSEIMWKVHCHDVKIHKTAQSRKIINSSRPHRRLMGLRLCFASLSAQRFSSHTILVLSLSFLTLSPSLIIVFNFSFLLFHESWLQHV